MKMARTIKCQKSGRNTGGQREEKERKFISKEENSISNNKPIIFKYYFTRIRCFLRGRNRIFANCEDLYTSNIEI
jgi:hypothetical protein